MLPTVSKDRSSSSASRSSSVFPQFIPESSRYDHNATHAAFEVFSVLFFHFLIIGMMLATFCCDTLFPLTSIDSSWLHVLLSCSTVSAEDSLFVGIVIVLSPIYV